MALTQVSTNGITDGTIVNADVGGSAAIAVSKLADFTANDANNRVLTATGTKNSYNGEANLTFDGNLLHLNSGSGGLPKIRVQHTGAGNDVFEITGGLTGISNSGFGIYDVDASAYRLAINSSGNVGIGTTAPTGAKLHIAHANEFGLYTSGGYNYQAKFESTDAEAAIVIEDSNSGTDYNRIGVITNDMTFITNNAERLRIASNGQVGIGGTPAYTLDVTAPGDEAQLRLNSGSGNHGMIRFSQAGTNKSYIQHVNGDHFAFAPSGTERLRIDSNGNVGIGTTTSIQKLTIDGGGVSIDNGWNAQWGANASRAYIQGEDATGNNRLILGTNNTERLRIASSGNVLINTSTVSGYSDRMLTVHKANDACYIEVRTDSDQQGGIIFSDGSAASAVSYPGYLAYNHTSDYMFFVTATSERMRIHSNGCVTKPANPAFFAKGTSSWIAIDSSTGNVDLAASTEVFDNGSNYNTSTYTFTAPVAGKYAFFSQMYSKFDNNSGYWSNYFTKNNTSSQEWHQLWGYGSEAAYQDTTRSAAAIIELAANDYVRYRIRTVGSDADYYGGHSTFSGYLIG